MSRDDRSTLDLVIEAYKPGIDRTRIQQNLRLTIEERVSQLMDLQRQAEELRKAGAAYGHRRLDILATAPEGQRPAGR